MHFLGYRTTAMEAALTLLLGTLFPAAQSWYPKPKRGDSCLLLRAGYRLPRQEQLDGTAGKIGPRSLEYGPLKEALGSRARASEKGGRPGNTVQGWTDKA